MDDWKKIVKQGRQILSEEESLREEKRLAGEKQREKEKRETIHSLKPNEYTGEYEKNIRAYFLVRKPIEDCVLNIRSSDVMFEKGEETPRAHQLGSFTLDIEVPVSARGEIRFAPAIRFHFAITQKEPYVIEYNRSYAMNYQLAYTYTYPRKYRRFLFRKKGLIEEVHEGSLSFSVRDFQTRDQLIEFLTGQFIAIMETGIDQFKEKSSILR